jgi:nicotinate phosphoribosyltransferase
MPKLPPLIHSLLDTDLYKFTMLQAILHQFPAAYGQYAFRCRNQPDFPLSQLHKELEAQLDWLCQLQFTQPELAYLRSLRFIKSDFVDYLELFHLQRRFIRVQCDGDALTIHIEGPLVQAMFFEIFVLAIVNELYFRRLDTPQVREEGQRRLDAKIATLLRFEAEESASQRFPLLISDFGTRRRFSREWQQQVVEQLNAALPKIFRGTSNVWLAWKLGITPIGTMAHEFFRPSRHWACGCATSRTRRWKPGYRNTAATWASRSPTWCAWMPSWRISTCTLPSCLTACATTVATRWNGQTRPLPITASCASTRPPRCSPSATA